jgi:hypothetical protein
MRRVSAALEHVYRYAGASEVTLGAAPRLSLVTSGGAAEHPHFFEGRIERPRHLGALLHGLSRIVGSRFYVPPAMLARILREADPVVTCGGGWLRFEGFSACASVHARVDVSPAAYQADVLSPGTTNVDFNATMRGALAGMRDGDPVGLAVGRGEVELRTGDTTIVEKRVPLPLRWLRGFVEVQAYQSRMKPLVEASGVEALRFLRGLPRTTTARHTVYVTGAGRALRTSTLASRGAVRVSGLQRLRVVEDLAPLAKRLVIHGDEAGQASAWVLELPDMRITLTLSGDVARGFSGEGQALEALAAGDDAPHLATIRAELRWQAAVDPGAVAERVGLERAEVDRALLVLGARGLVGHDVTAGTFFHRELPYDLERVREMQPRLVGARKLVESGKVKRLASAGEGVVAFAVAGTDVEHRVTLGERGARCTCPWFSKHQGERGPCKHVLAAQITADGEEA